MRSGLLSHIITIQSQSIEINEYGEQVITYKTKSRCKAREIHKSGNRILENDEIMHIYNKVFEIWKFIDVEDTDFILYNNHQYRILSIEVDNKQLKKIIITELVNE